MNEPQPGTTSTSVFWVGGEENHAGYATVIIKDSKTNGAIKRGLTDRGGGLWVKNTGTLVFEKPVPSFNSLNSKWAQQDFICHPRA
ncbi:MAG: hypothetical protein IKQ77_02650 [Prevotella sp.]|jgi:hypothetical protein|nr:hypothetical protein [Prevotella sp.]